MKSIPLLATMLCSMNTLAQTVSAEDITMQPGNEAKISINLTEATQFNAAGMYIVLPEGFSFDTIEKGEAANAEDTLALGLQAATILRFALIDEINNAAFTTDGTLLETTIVCDSTVKVGTYTAEIKTIELSNANTAKGLTTMPDLSLTITVVNDPATGMQNVEAVEEKVPEIYDTTGKRVSSVHKGVYIYKYQNGNVKKAVLK